MTEHFFDHDRLDVYRLSIEYVAAAFASSRSLEGLHRHARNHLQTKYGFADSRELHSAIKASCDAGEMINSGYILWYLRPKLNGESNLNVDDIG